MEKHGNLSAADFLDLLQNNYPKGYKSGEYRFICVIGSQGQDAIQSKKINEPDKVSIVSYKSVETYLSEARKHYQNTV